VNYLDLVQMVARESGTVPGTQPLTLSGDQPARLKKIAHWVDAAWNMIQNHKAGWHWMKATYQATTAPGVARYSSVALGIARFNRFVAIPGTMTIMDPAIGVRDEGFLSPLDYWNWRKIYGIGEQTPNRPVAFSVHDPDQTLCLGPLPDKEYTITGEYYKSPQSLLVDTDIPELPEAYHPMIGWQALMLLAGHDEGAFAVGNAAAQYRQYLGNLERDQLPKLQTYRHFV
jgi:hypothetical protein